MPINVMGEPEGIPLPYSIMDALPSKMRVVGYNVATSKREEIRSLYSGQTEPLAAATSKDAEVLTQEQQARARDGWVLVTVPVYVGVGLRLSADVLALQGGITLAGLGAIGAEAEA